MNHRNQTIVSTLLFGLLGPYEISAQDVPESCQTSDPVFAYELNQKRARFRMETEEIRRIREVLLEDYPADDPAWSELRTRESEMPKVLAEVQQRAVEECIENVRTEGEWFPEGTTLQEWRSIKAQIAQRYQCFGIMHTSFKVDLGQLDVVIIDWDVGVNFSFVKEGGSWVISKGPRY